jgi:thioredoxin reductase (NADPH)
MLWSHVVTQAKGADFLEAVRVKDLKTDEERDIPVAGLFFAIGHTPNTAFLGGQIDIDEQGYIVTKPDSTQTNIPGVFAAGDVQDKKWRQAITAAGTGCMAALEAEHFLADNP